jgi:hypothetical protein
MDGEEEQLSGVVAFSNNLFGSIAMMDINIDNRTALAQQPFVRDRMHGTSGNTIEYTKPARFSSIQQSIDSGMMAWGADYAKSVPLPSNKNAGSINTWTIQVRYNE